MRSHSIVVFSPQRRFDAALEASGDVEIRARVERLEDLDQAVGQHHPDSLLVSLDDDPDAVFEALDKLLAPKPLLFFHGPDDSRLILRAMRAGAYEYVAPGADQTEQLIGAIRRAARESADQQAHRSASLVTVIGAKGGVGATFVACQLAASLARPGSRAALVDGHFRHGDVALYLDLQPRFDLASLAVNEGHIDESHLRTALTSHPSGVAVLAAPQDPQDAEAVTTACIEDVIGLLRSDFSWVVWDAPYDFGERNLRVIDQAQVILLVSTPDVPSLNHTRMQLELLERLGRRKGDLRVVLNRCGSSGLISSRDASEFLKRPVDASIPNDFRVASACVNEGRSLDQMGARSSLGASVGELARLMHAWCDRPLPQPRRRGLLDRLRGR